MDNTERDESYQNKVDPYEELVNRRVEIVHAPIKAASDIIEPYLLKAGGSSALTAEALKQAEEEIRAAQEARDSVDPISQLQRTLAQAILSPDDRPIIEAAITLLEEQGRDIDESDRVSGPRTRWGFEFGDYKPELFGSERYLGVPVLQISNQDMSEREPQMRELRDRILKSMGIQETGNDLVAKAVTFIDAHKAEVDASYGIGKPVGPEYPDIKVSLKRLATAFGIGPFSTNIPGVELRILPPNFRNYTDASWGKKEPGLYALLDQKIVSQVQPPSAPATRPHS